MWQDFLIGFCLFLIFEGIMPFLNPKAFRETMLKAAQMDDSTLRFVGLTCMLIGVGLMYWIR